jgi:hypothetical protein
VGQNQERLLPDWREFHDHTVVSLRVLFDEQAEHEPVWPIDLEVFPRVLDILAEPVTHHPETSANLRVDVRADCIPNPAREQKGPRLLSIKPGIKDALRRRAELTADAHAGGS